MDLNNILSQLGAGTKGAVYLSVTPGVGLELIELDASARTVKNYAYRPLEYNESLREIADIEAFKNAVVELFAELHINIKSSVILNLPMVLFGSKELALLLGDDQITEALTSVVEQSYIFKRYEPVVCWCDAVNSQSGDTRKLFYSAIQKNSIDDIKAALAELGANLVGVEMSLTSLLKGLAFTGLAADQMRENFSWNLMIITPSGYAICSMVGKSIVDYYEEPLAIKSFEGDEIYNAINASAQVTLMSYPANSLYIVSETNMVSAEILSKRMSVDCPISYWDNNDFKKQDALAVSLEVLEDTAHKISLEAIGLASGTATNMPVKFNFMTGIGGADGIDDPDTPVRLELFGSEFDISPNDAKKLARRLSALIIIPILAVAIGVPMFANKKQARLDEINSRLNTANAEIKKIQEEQNKMNDFDVNAEIKSVLANNRAKLLSYTALGDSVPRKLWITYFVAKDDGKFDIKGEADNVEDIYAFFRNMKDSLINTQVRLHKLEMKSDSVDDAVTIDPNQPTDYEFEITNMSAAQLNSPPPAQDANAAAANGAPNAAPPADQNAGAAEPPKPLLNFLGK